MRRLRRLAWAGLATLSLAAGAPARGDEATAPDPGPRRVGVAWMAGNGFGIVGGEVSVLVARHVAVALHLAWAHGDAPEVTAYGFTPIVRAYLEPEGSTFYGAAGPTLAWKTSNQTQGAYDGGTLSWLSYGLVANVGYEWRWPPVAALFLGAGVGWRPGRTITNGVDTFEEARYLGLNVEAGFRILLF